MPRERSELCALCPAVSPHLESLVHQLLRQVLLLQHAVAEDEIVPQLELLEVLESGTWRKGRKDKGEWVSVEGLSMGSK
jgi:hypothetical protein